ncbi:MAG TPA: bacterial Ig-like domain-containing protein, partial [Bacillota bacterium]|nr:bacterial Ig-like domain-containing protein [Bacillota bacterium]
AVNDPVAWTDNISGNETVYSYWLEAYIDGRWVTLDPACGTHNTFIDGVKKRKTGITGLYFDPSDSFFAQSHMTLEYENAPVYNGYESIDEKTFINGTPKNASAFELPDKLTAYTSLGSIVCDVIWNVKNCSYDENGIGKQTFTVYGTIELPEVFAILQETSQSVSVTVTVNARVLVSVSVKREPDTTVFFQGNTLDLQGLELLLTYDNLKSEISSEGYTVTCDMSEPGIKTATVQYGYFFTEYKVRVLSALPLSLEIAKPMTKTVYYTDDKLDITGLELFCCYEDGYKFDAAEYGIEYDFSKPGECEVVFTSGGLAVSQTVSVIQLMAVGASITKLPDITEYRYGDTFDFSGLTLEITYNNGSVMTVSNGIEFLYTLPDGASDFVMTVSALYSGVSVDFTVAVSKKEQLSESSTFVAEESEKEEVKQNGMTTWEIISASVAALIVALVVAGFVDKWQTMKKLREFMKEQKK